MFDNEKKQWLQFVLAGTMALVLSVGYLGNAFAKEEKGEIPSIVISVGHEQDVPVYEAGETKELSIEIENDGSATAQKVKISPIIENNGSEWPFEIMKMSEEYRLGNIEAGKKAELKVVLQAKEDVKSQYHQLRLALQYEDDDNVYRGEKHVFVRTNQKQGEGQEQEPPNIPESEPGNGGGGISNGGGETKPSMPRVIVTGFRTDPSEVRAGSNFRLFVKVKNTSGSVAVKNMLYTFRATPEGKDENVAPAFLAASGSNSVYSDGLGAGEEKEVEIALNAKADLLQKPYSVELAMKYEDSNATQYETVSTVSVPVTQPARFEVSEIQVNPDVISVGEDANVTANLYNLGRMKLYNVKAKIQGKAMESEEVFIGNVDSGSQSVIDLMGKGKAEGTDEVMKLVLTYEDAEGNKSTFEKEFKATVTEAVNSEDIMAMPKEEKKGFPVIPVVAGVLVIAAVVTFVVRKKKKRKGGTDELSGYIEDEQQ